MADVGSYPSPPRKEFDARWHPPGRQDGLTADEEGFSNRDTLSCGDQFWMTSERWVNIASVDTSNPAMDGQVKTGHQASVRDW